MAWVGKDLRDHPKAQTLDFTNLKFSPFFFTDFNLATRKTYSIKLIMYFIICYRLFRRNVKLFH